MPQILGLDLGTNSIGWSIVEKNDNDLQSLHMIDAGSRILPMTADQLSDFDKGNTQSACAERRLKRTARRMNERRKMRRERLMTVLKTAGFIPEDCETDAEHSIAYPKSDNGEHEFAFTRSFNQMLQQSKAAHPQFTSEGKLIPHDWTLYYLRHKALTQALTPAELAWVILSFNTKRGYYQLEDAEQPSESKSTTDVRKEFCSLTVDDVQMVNVDSKDPRYNWYTITYTNGLQQKRRAPNTPCNPGDHLDAIVTTTYDAQGNVKLDRDGQPKIKVSTPGADDWTLRKKRTEALLDNKSLTVGSYIYQSLLNDPDVKVRGQLVHTIDRTHYASELRKILQNQAQHIAALTDREVLQRCLARLYPSNDAQRNRYANKTLIDLIVDDVVFYQRPLRSNKSLIDRCQFETRQWLDPETGQMQVKGVACAPRSHPAFAEYRLWQFISNLRILRRQGINNGKPDVDFDVTNEYLPDAYSRAALFDALIKLRDINQEQFLGAKGLRLHTAERKNLRWNYPEDKTYPCNPTHADIERRWPGLDNSQKLALWHILYSVTDRTERIKALKRFARKNGIADVEGFAEALRSLKLDDGYAAYSLKAINKMLPLMRQDHHWSADNIDAATRQRLEGLMEGVVNGWENAAIAAMGNRNSIDQFQGLGQYQAAYAVYNRHSEAADLTRWQSPADIDAFLLKFKQHSLRNPVVEQLATETLRVVRDIWQKYGAIDEIHIEMGRNLKQDARGRKNDYDRNRANESANLRVKRLLAELAKPQHNVDGVRPDSKPQQELLRIVDDSVLTAGDVPDDIARIAQKLGDARVADISSADITRYRLWLEQQYKSPYTGQVIPLSRLFTVDYQIEHIIPQARYFDDSLANKVVCEALVNREKGARLGREFIAQSGGSVLPGPGGKSVKILNLEQYDAFVAKHYAHNRAKMRRLMLDEITDDFSQRQLTDTRYMSRMMLQLLSAAVRAPGETEAVSRRVIATNGAITDRLKHDWGLHDVWNDVIAPRFRRLNQMTNSNLYGQDECVDGRRFFRTQVPFDLAPGFNKKRIDHRHHALDAIVIACTTRSIVNYLNNASAADSRRDERRDIRAAVCHRRKDGSSQWLVNKPWPSFTTDVRTALLNMLVSFKVRRRVLTKNGQSMALRVPLHKETVYGLREINGNKYSVVRKPIEGFDAKTIAKVTDPVIKRILTAHLAQCGGNASYAFSPDGIEQLNANIAQLNNGIAHKPIKRVPVGESIGLKFAIGTKGINSKKFVEAAVGTNLYFAIYVDSTGRRSYQSIPLRDVITRMMAREPVAPAVDVRGRKLLMVLSPGDVVAVTATDGLTVDYYKVVNFTGTTLLFAPLTWAFPLPTFKGGELNSGHKQERDLEGRMIKEICQPVTIDRLGHLASSNDKQ